MPSSTVDTAHSTPITMAPPPYPIFNPSASVTIIKLTRHNYPLWRAQIIPYLKGHDVFGFIDGTIVSPPSLTIAADGSTTTNPLYALWVKNDNLILSALTSSLSEEVLAQVYHASTSAAIWLSLQTCFASQSRAKVIQVRSQLATIRKGGSSATEYFMTIKKLTDDLAIAGHPLSNEDIITYVLTGLGPEYDPLVTMLSSHPHLTLEDIFSHLLTTEARLLHHQQTPATAHIPSSTIVVLSPTPTPAAHFTTKISSFDSPYRGSASSRGRGCFSTRGRGSGRSYNHSNTTICCQLCHKHRHTAQTCWWRYDQRSTMRPPSQSMRPPSQPTAYYTHSHVQPCTNWLPDTGATHHMTSDVHHLPHHSEVYTGSDQIHVGNGAGLLGPHPT